MEFEKDRTYTEGIYVCMLHKYVLENALKVSESQMRPKCGNVS